MLNLTDLITAYTEYVRFEIGSNAKAEVVIEKWPYVDFKLDVYVGDGRWAGAKRELLCDLIGFDDQPQVHGERVAAMLCSDFKTQFEQERGEPHWQNNPFRKGDRVVCPDGPGVVDSVGYKWPHLWVKVITDKNDRGCEWAVHNVQLEG